MSTKTTYSCDRCKSEFSDRTAMKCVSVGLAECSESRCWFQWRQDWCHGCLNEFGWPSSSQQKATSAASPVQPTIENIIREIIRSEVQP